MVAELDVERHTLAGKEEGVTTLAGGVSHPGLDQRCRRRERRLADGGLQRRNKVGASGRDLKHFSHCAHEEISSLRGGPAAPNFGTGQRSHAMKPSSPEMV